MIQKQSPYHRTSPYRHFQTTQTAAFRIHRCSKSHSDAAVFRGRFHLRKRELFRWTWLWFCDLLVSCLVFWRSCSVSFRFAFWGHLNIWWKTMKGPLIQVFPILARSQLWLWEMINVGVLVSMVKSKSSIIDTVSVIVSVFDIMKLEWI